MINWHIKKLTYIGNKIYKIKLACHRLIIKQCIIDTYNSYPNYDYKVIELIAKEIAIKLLDFDIYKKEDNKEVTDKYFKEILNIEETILTKNWIKYYLSQYFFVSAFYKTFFKERGFRKDILLNFRRARHYDKKLSSIKSMEGLELFNLNIKSKTLEVNTTLKKIQKNFLLKKRKEYINPIEIKSSSILFFITIASTLFLSSGIINKKSFYFLLNFDCSLFFTISDYLSGSIDELITLTITLLFIFITLFYKFLENVDNTIEQEIYERNTDYKKSDKKIANIFIVGLFLNAILYFYLLKEIPYVFIYPLILAFLFYLLDKINLEKYISNYKDIYIFLFISIIFISNILFGVVTKVQNIKKDDYKSDYNVIFKTEKEIYKKLQLIDTTSSFLLFINTENKNIVAIPIQEASSIFKEKKN